VCTAGSGLAYRSSGVKGDVECLVGEDGAVVGVGGAGVTLRRPAEGQHGLGVTGEPVTSIVKTTAVKL
jgi:hypothetical protein